MKSRYDRLSTEKDAVFRRLTGVKHTTFVHMAKILEMQSSKKMAIGEAKTIEKRKQNQPISLESFWSILPHAQLLEIQTKVKEGAQKATRYIFGRITLQQLENHHLKKIIKEDCMNYP